MKGEDYLSPLKFYDISDVISRTIKSHHQAKLE